MKRRRPSAALLLAALATQACIHHVIGALGEAVADEPEHWVARTDPAEQLQDVLQDAAEALCQEQINAFADCIESQMECNATTTRCQNHPQEAMERCTALQMSQGRVFRSSCRSVSVCLSVCVRLSLCQHLPAAGLNIRHTDSSDMIASSSNLPRERNGVVASPVCNYPLGT